MCSFISVSKQIKGRQIKSDWSCDHMTWHGGDHLQPTVQCSSKIKMHSVASLYMSRFSYTVTMQHLATSINLPAAFLVCLRLRADRWTVLCVSSAASLRAASWYSDSPRSPGPSPLLPPWHSHTGKYDRHPLWLPRLPDGSDRRRQQHSEEDYAQSLLWWVQSHLLGRGKP